jgi:hypothetical protein
MKPGVRIQGPISHIAATKNQTPSVSHPARKTEPTSKIANVATPTRYPPQSKDALSKIQCRACDKFGHYARECPNPSTKPMSERPNAYARTKSPAPDRKDYRTRTANVAIEKQDNTYGWDNEVVGLGCMTVHTVPGPVRFNTTCLTDTVTNLPIVAHTLAPSLQDDGDVESHLGPINTPMGQWVDKNEEQLRINAFSKFGPPARLRRGHEIRKCEIRDRINSVPAHHISNVTRWIICSSYALSFESTLRPIPDSVASRAPRVGEKSPYSITFCIVGYFAYRDVTS